MKHGINGSATCHMQLGLVHNTIDEQPHKCVCVGPARQCNKARVCMCICSTHVACKDTLIPAVGPSCQQCS